LSIVNYAIAKPNELRRKNTKTALPGGTSAVLV